MENPADLISLHTRLAPNPNFFLREEEDDGGLLIDPDTGSVQILNIPAVEVWKLLDGRRSIFQVLGDLEKIFDGMDNTAEAQVLKLVREFYRLGALGMPAEGVSA